MYDMCQEVLEKQTNIEKSNKEIVEKLRLTDEKLESIQFQLKADKIDETIAISSNSLDSEDSVKTTSSSDSSQEMVNLIYLCPRSLFVDFRFYVKLCQRLENTLC